MNSSRLNLKTKDRGCIELADESNDGTLTLNSLNAECADMISRFLGNKDIANVRLASYNTSQLFYTPQLRRSVLLRAIAHGNPVKAKAILLNNPDLLLKAGDVETPSGAIVMNVTPYECALGAGDDDIAAMIKEFFNKIPNGEVISAKQYARFQNQIKSMLTQPAYDFSVLMQALKNATSEDVTAALNLQFDEKIPLHAELEKMRNYFSPKIIIDGMHFNYADQVEAYSIYENESENLHDGSNYDKCDLFCRQVIGFIQRSLSACDRQATAQHISAIISDNEKLQRTFNFKYGNAVFPITAGDISHTGLGYQYWAVAEMCPIGWEGQCFAADLKLYYQTKMANLQTLGSQVSPADTLKMN